jgi:hypothetical protein
MTGTTPSEDNAMHLRHPIARPEHFAVRPVLACAQCGDRLLAPEWSEYLDRSRVRHLWACEACGYEFETLVRFPAEAAA